MKSRSVHIAVRCRMTSIASAAIITASLLTVAASRQVIAAAASADSRPNILLIIADDLGYADLGAYGGDIDTPNIDSLAQQGMMFSRYHTAPMCAPTRAMLYSGNNNHIAGMASQGVEGLLDEPMRGYENSLSTRIMPFPRLLADAGYHTYLTGKWHLGTEKAHSPQAAGFENSFALLEGAGTHFDSRGYKEGGSTYWLNDDYADYPVGRYSTDVYISQLIEFIDANQGDDQPFLAVAALTTPHWPLQVPDEYLDLYEGHYDDGYDALRERRFESLQRAGVIPASAMLPNRNSSIARWESLVPEEQRRESRKMELYAAMVDNLDDHVGRLLQYLRDHDLYDKTLIVFMSDNGAAAEDFYNTGSYVDYVRANFDNSLDNMGRPNSFVSYGPQWAEAGSAPFQYYKGYTREGGMVAPLIIAGPGVAQMDTVNDAYATVMDLAPTFLETGRATYPADGSVQAMLGSSMVSVLSGKAAAVHDDDYVTTLSHRGRSFLRKGDWKIANVDGPFDESEFELFNLALDPGETTNLATENPEKYTELVDLWRSERLRLGIILPEDL